VRSMTWRHCTRSHSSRGTRSRSSNRVVRLSTTSTGGAAAAASAGVGAWNLSVSSADRRSRSTAFVHMSRYEAPRTPLLKPVNEVTIARSGVLRL
jgi:hypothetical protein